MLNVCVYDDLDDDYDVCSSPCSYRQPVGRGQLLSRRYCKHSGWLFLCAKYTAPIVPRRFGGFAQVLQKVQVAVHGCIPTRQYVILIKLTLKKIFEYVKMTI